MIHNPNLAPRVCRRLLMAPAGMLQGLFCAIVCAFFIKILQTQNLCEFTLYKCERMHYFVNVVKYKIKIAKMQNICDGNLDFVLFYHENFEYGRAIKVKDENKKNALDDLQEVLKDMEQQVKKLPDLFLDVMSMGIGLDGDTPMNSREIADELRGEYIDLTPEMVEEAQKDAAEMMKFLPQLEKDLPADGRMDPGLCKIGVLCSWRRMDLLRRSAKDEESLESTLKSEYESAEFVRMPVLRDLYEYRGDADVFHDETFRPEAWECRKMKAMARRVAEKLREMGKTLLPDVSGSQLMRDAALEYCYLGADLAKEIVTKGGKQ